MSDSQYLVVDEEFLVELEETVNELMVDGWIPHGGITAGHRPNDPGTKGYAQAMTRVKDDVQDAGGKQ